MLTRPISAKGWVAAIVLVAIVLTYRVATLQLAPMVQDQGRDMHYAMCIAQGREFPLLGPPMSIDLSARGSPVYYYLIALGCLIGGRPLAAVVEANLLWWAAVVVAWVALRQLFGARAAVFAAVFLLICPELLHTTDTVWNPFMPATFSLLTFSFALLFANSGKVRWWYAFALAGAACAHMHPMACLAALAFLPIVAHQPVPAKHKVTACALCASLAAPMLIGLINAPRHALSWYCLALYMAIGALLAIGHSLARKTLPKLLAFYWRQPRPVWGLVLVLSVYFIVQFSPGPSRPTLWLLAFFALLNVVKRRREDDPARGMAGYVELPVIIICLVPFVLILAANLAFGAQPRAHYLSYAVPIIAVYVGLRLFRVARGAIAGSRRFVTPRATALNRAILLATIILLTFGHIWNHAILVGVPYISTFDGSRTMVEGLLDEFGNDKELFDGRVFAYPRVAGNEDEECAWHVYYHLLKDGHATPSVSEQTPYVLIVSGWEAPRGKHPACFLATHGASAFKFTSWDDFAELLRDLGIDTPPGPNDFWQVPFYVGGYTPEKWLSIALANDGT